MKSIILIMILIFLYGCEYAHAPDEIHVGVTMSETNLEPIGRPITTGMYIGGVWYRTERLKRYGK